MLVNAALDLYNVVINELRCDVAREKSAVIASSDKVAKRIADK